MTNGWKCYLCDRLFIHARILTTHLIEFHNAGPAR